LFCGHGNEQKRRGLGVFFLYCITGIATKFSPVRVALANDAIMPAKPKRVVKAIDRMLIDDNMNKVRWGGG
jgi:hypothetical protein